MRTFRLELHCMDPATQFRFVSSRVTRIRSVTWFILAVDTVRSDSGLLHTCKCDKSDIMYSWRRRGWEAAGGSNQYVALNWCSASHSFNHEFVFRHFVRCKIVRCRIISLRLTHLDAGMRVVSSVIKVWRGVKDIWVTFKSNRLTTRLSVNPTDVNLQPSCWSTMSLWGTFSRTI